MEEKETHLVVFVAGDQFVYCGAPLDDSCLTKNLLDTMVQ